MKKLLHWRTNGIAVPLCASFFKPHAKARGETLSRTLLTLLITGALLAVWV